MELAVTQARARVAAHAARWSHEQRSSVPFLGADRLLVAALDPGFLAAHGLTADAQALGWLPFLWRNLVPVTLGNVAGGTLAVGAVYWFVYLRPGTRA